MYRKYLDLTMAVTVALLNALWVLLHSGILVVGIILALPLVLVLPGYTLSEVLFRKRSLNPPERLVLSLGLSLAIDILSGLFLNLLPVGLQAASWATLLGLLTIFFSLLAAYLRRGVPGSGSGARPLQFHLSVYQGILFGLAISVAILSFAYAAFGVAQQPYPGFTQFWMLPEAQAGKSCVVRLGVRSFESTPVTFHLAITANGEHLSELPPFSLAPQKEWNRLVTVAPMATAEIYVEAQLYRLDKPGAVYREVHLTFNNLGGNKGGGARLCGVPPISSSSANLVDIYNGTFYNIPTGLKSSMSLTGIRQSGRNFTGYLTISGEKLRNVSFKGIIISAQDIQFTVTGSSGIAPLFFEGKLQPSGTLSGSYCGLDQAGQCNNSNAGYGLWIVMPAS
jgi:uncharacterized membrane protein